jgi:GTP cyclohydrolase I
MAEHRQIPGQAIPIPQQRAANLSALGGSSTGSWERGRLGGNARSPPGPTNPLSSSPSLARASVSLRNDEGEPEEEHKERLKGSKALQEVDAKYTRSFSERPQREGYGFRPASGTSTPNVEVPSQTLAWPGRYQAKNEEKEGEQVLDISASALNSIRGLNLGGSGAPRSGMETPIPDAHGLGWPGWCLVVQAIRLLLTTPFSKVNPPPLALDTVRIIRQLAQAVRSLAHSTGMHR